jgi:hypothetical protein
VAYVLGMPVAHLLEINVVLMILQSSGSLLKTGVYNIRSECQPPAESRLKVAIDYLCVSGVIPTALLAQLVQYVNDFLGDHLLLEFGVPGSQGKTWSNSIKSPSGVRILWNELNDDAIQVYVQIPGNPLRRLDNRDSWRMCLGFLNCYGLICRRFDVALDDYLRRVTVDELIEIGEKDNFRLVDTYSLASSKKRGDSSAKTVYFGSRESEKYLRFYDAEKVHGLPCDRWEVELKRRHANEAFKEFCSLPVGLDSEEFNSFASQFLASLVTGSVDFVDAENASEGERYDRLKRLPFWQSLIDDVGGSLRLSPPRSKPTLQRTLGWIKRQVVCSLAVVRKGYGHQMFYKWLDSVLGDAEKRFNSYHKSTILAVQNEISKDMFPVS